MAQAVVRVAVIAICVALFVTAEDRRARSGDLDRGPPFGEPPEQRESLGGNGRVIRYFEGGFKSVEDRVVLGQEHVEPLPGKEKRNLVRRWPLQDLEISNAKFQGTSAENNNENRDHFQNTDDPKGSTEENPFSENSDETKHLRDLEYKLPSNAFPSYLSSTNPLWKTQHEIPNKDKRTPEMAFDTSSDEKRIENISFEPSALEHVTNLRYKLPFGAEQDYLSSTEPFRSEHLKEDINNLDELIKETNNSVFSDQDRSVDLENNKRYIPRYSALTDDTSLDLQQKQMRSEEADNMMIRSSIDHNPSEISFEIADEQAMPLKRRVELSTEFFLVPSSSSPASTSTSSVHITKTRNPEEGDKIGGVFRNEVWVIPVVALSAVTMLLIAGFEVFVLCKAWRTTPSRRHLFLGQMLLLGLFSCAGLASVVAASPTQFTCALMRFGTGVAYAIVFASLLVKCVFLISLNGGVYLPAPYQGLLLLFAILIQVAIGVQWLLTSPPLVDIITVEQVVHQNRNRLLVTAADISTTQVVPLCRTPYVDVVLSLIYVIFLIIFVTVLAVKSRGIRDNYREATYIGLSVGCSIPTWLIWTISGLVVSDRHKDACIAFGLVIVSIMVFLIMFMPKGRQLAAMGKEGVYVEDREDRFSSLSRAGSGYSPSFFHFKPIKYGVNYGSKQQHVTTLGGGVGDVAPPSYTRFYQYYSSPPGYYSTRYLPGGLYLRPDDGNLYTTLEPTLSSNPNVYFQRGNGLHPGMMY